MRSRTNSGWTRQPSASSPTTAPTTAITWGYTPAYALLLTDRDFWRAANSLQLDETIGLYAAQLTGEHKHLAMIANRHPLLPLSTLRAGFRLMLHGLSTEILHGFLTTMERRQANLRQQPA